MVPIQSASLFPVIASSEPTVPSPATAAVWNESAGCWSTKEHTQERFIFSISKFSDSENEWVAQVSLLRPGFFLTISPGRKFVPPSLHHFGISAVCPTWNAICEVRLSRIANRLRDGSLANPSSETELCFSNH